MTSQAYSLEGSSILNRGLKLNQSAAHIPEEEYVNGRFGQVKINRANAVYFPRGILGFPENLDFCLAEFPSDKMQQFKILQCISDTDLSFAVLPVAVQNDLIQMPDIEEALAALQIEKNDLALLLIVSVHRKTSSVNLSVNLRAPIFLDTGKKLAAQYVLSNNNYEIRHFIQG